MAGKVTLGFPLPAAAALAFGSPRVYPLDVWAELALLSKSACHSWSFCNLAISSLISDAVNGQLIQGSVQDVDGKMACKPMQIQRHRTPTGKSKG